MSSILLRFSKILLFVLIFLSVITHVVIARMQIGIKKRPAYCPVQTKNGDFIHVHYKGQLENGTEFDNSYTRGEPLSFTLGSSQVIKGWDQGLLNMCKGELRKLVIPPELAYGDRGAPPLIPKFSTLIFHVELVKIEPKDEL